MPPLVLRKVVSDLEFAAPVAHVYNPLEYAWASHEAYLRLYGQGRKKVVFVGMNPGPFGMVQTGIPFGEIAAVRDWLKIESTIGRPASEHPRRPVTGFACTRSEVSGRRLWGLFASRYGSAAQFFRDHFVLNYCPLAFLEDSGRNRTPDKLPPAERKKLFAACDAHLGEALQILRPAWVVGVGEFAATRAADVCAGAGPQIGKIHHPSPANPAANRDWAAIAELQLRQLGIWK